MRENSKDLKRNLRYLRKKPRQQKRSIARKLGGWLRTLFPKRGQVFASQGTLRDEKFVNDSIQNFDIYELKTQISYCRNMRMDFTVNAVDKAIYKRLRRRLRNRYYDLKSDRAVLE